MKCAISRLSHKAVCYQQMYAISIHLIVDEVVLSVGDNECSSVLSAIDSEIMCYQQ